MSVGLWSCEGSTWAREFASELTCVVSPRGVNVLPCGSLHRVPSWHNKWLSPKAHDLREGAGDYHGCCRVFYNLILKVVCHHFCHIWLVTQIDSGTVWEGTTQGCDYREATITGLSWRLAPTSCNANSNPTSILLTFCWFFKFKQTRYGTYGQYKSTIEKHVMMNTLCINFTSISD